jgi:23S rRNA (cytosine1962-C5)-methyltransferase
MLIITIKQGKEKSLLAGEPWIYATAVERVDGRGAELRKVGGTAIVQSSSTKFLARAAYNPHSQIRARVWTFREDEPVDHAMLKRRVKTALEHSAARAAKARPDEVVRLIEGDKEGLSGLLVDQYGGKDGYLICQFQAAGVELWKVAIVQALIAHTACPNVYERSDELVRKGEGLPVFARALAGVEPPQRLMVNENGKTFPFDLRTGFRYPR